MAKKVLGGLQGRRINFEEVDTNADGKIIAEEMVAHREAHFAAQDTNADGLLSARVTS